MQPILHLASLSAAVAALCCAGCRPCGDDVGYQDDLTTLDFDAQSTWPDGLYRVSLQIDDVEHQCEVTLPSGVTDPETCSSDGALEFPSDSSGMRLAVTSIFVERSLPTDRIGVRIERDGALVFEEELFSWDEMTEVHEERGQVCATTTFVSARVELPW